MTPQARSVLAALAAVMVGHEFMLDCKAQVVVVVKAVAATRSPKRPCRECCCCKAAPPVKQADANQRTCEIRRGLVRSRLELPAIIERITTALILRSGDLPTSIEHTGRKEIAVRAQHHHHDGCGSSDRLRVRVGGEVINSTPTVSCKDPPKRRLFRTSMNESQFPRFCDNHERAIIVTR